MPKAKLTKSFLARVKPQEKDQHYWDDSITGFGARVYPNGTIKLIFKYESPITQKRVVMVLGKFIPETIDEIRMRASAFRSLVDLKKDPKLESEKRLKEQHQAHEQNTNCSVKAMIEKHLDRAQHENKAATLKDKTYMMNHYVIPFIGNMPAHEVYKEDIEQLVLNIKAKYATPKNTLDRTCNKMLSYLSKVYSDAISWEREWAHITKNPIQYIKIEKAQAKTTYLTKDEMVRAIKVVDSIFDQDEKYLKESKKEKVKLSTGVWIVGVRLMCGTRSGETSKALRKHIDLENRIWHIPAENNKGGVDREVPLNDKALNYFKRILAMHKHEHVFANTFTGKPVENYKKSLKLVLQQAGIAKAITPHDLRRTFGCNLLLGGCDIYTVSKLLGHKSVTVTEQHYAFLNINFLQAEVQKLNQLIS